MKLSQDIKNAAWMLSKAQHGVAFTGAGISTPSGIPDFRSERSGLWEQVDPMEVASIFGFRHNPQAFFKWVRPLAELILKAQPNPAHLALAELGRLGRLRAVITQNIDTLHTHAGSEPVYELHGHLREVTCIHCFTVYPGLPIMERFLADEAIPRCEKCQGILKPNTILFGEQLPYQALQGAMNAARRADALLVVGSSLEVAPASDLPLIARRNGAKIIIINLEPTDMDRMADLVIHANAAEALPAIVAAMKTS